MKYFYNNILALIKELKVHPVFAILWVLSNSREEKNA